jgi:3-(3-hydroxy-phenyl)propionate hydroxylase
MIELKHIEQKPETYDVVVVGAGPTGLTLSRLLTARGINVAVIDPNRIVCHHPRATHVDDEAMRILQSIGLSESEREFLKFSSWEIKDAEGNVALAWDMKVGETDQGWLMDYMFHQPDFESQVRGALAMNDNATLWLGWQAEAVAQDATSATVELRHRKSGETTTISASYVVGCDGSRSSVREATMKGLEDLDGTKDSIIIDVEPFGEVTTLPKTGGFILCQGDTPITYVPGVPPILRFQFMLGAFPDLEVFDDPMVVYGLLERWLEPGSYRIMRSDVYQWNAHLVEGWREGRLMIAGDAAHLMPPMLGQGMCSGMRDASNLAWKLEAVVSGRAYGSLLDTYESERSPHVRNMIVESARQQHLIEAMGQPGWKREAPTGERLVRGHQPVGPGFSPAGFALAGELSPQPRTDDGTRLDDVVGYNFAVLGDTATIASVSAETVSAWERLGVVVVSSPSAGVDEWLADSGIEAAIIRPDHYVFGGTNGAAELENLTAVLAAQLVREQVAA